MSKYQIAVFDFDGTIMNTIDGVANSVRYAILNTIGEDVSDENVLKEFFGPPLNVSFRKNFQMTDAQIDTAVRIYREHYSEHGVLAAKPFEGAREGLSRLQSAGIKTAIASSKYIGAIHAILERTHLQDVFDIIVGSEDPLAVDRTKAQCIQEALRRLDCNDPTIACMVGDRNIDAKGASIAGTGYVAALYGGAERSEFDAYSVDCFATDFSACVEYILAQE